MAAVLLQRYSFDGTMAGEGSLNLALQNTGTTLGTPSYASGPVAGTQALVITTGKYLSLPYSTSLDFTSTSTFSVGGWFYVDTNATNPALFSNSGLANQSGLQFYFYSSGNAAGAAVWQSGTFNLNQFAITPNAYNSWTHWWVVYNGVNLKVYRSGVLVFTSGTTTLNFSSNLGWQICRNNRDPKNMTGAIADVRWYSGVMNPLDILYPPTLLQRYSFDGTLAGEGSLALAFVNPDTTLGTPAYSTGPLAGTQAVAIPTSGKKLVLPFHSSLNFDKGQAFSFGGWYKHTANTAEIMTNLSAGKGFDSYTVGSTILNSEIQVGGIRAGVTYTAFPGGINRWIHWWFVHDGTTLKSYCDGALLGSFSSGSNSFASTVGWTLSGIRTGFISDVRWYSGVVLPAVAQAALAPSVLPIVATKSSVNSSGSDGSITQTVSGGNGSSYTYAWTKNGTAIAAVTKDLTGLGPGTYVCTITSATVTATTTTVISAVLGFQNTPYSTRVSFPPVSSAVQYAVDYALQPGGTPLVLYSATAATSFVVPGLAPTKQYLFRVFGITAANVRTLAYSGTTTLPATTDTAQDFAVAALKGAKSGTGVNIGAVKGSAALSKEAILNSILTTGDTVLTTATAPGRAKTVEAKTVKLSETAPVVRNSAIYAPFDNASATTTQVITLTLRSGATQLVYYNTGTKRVTINGSMYKVGDKLLLDGQALSILEA